MVEKRTGRQLDAPPADDNDEPGTDVVTIDAPAPPAVASYLSSSKAAVEEDPEQVAWEIVQRILSAQSPDEVLSRQQVMSAKELLGFPLIIERVRWQRSAYEQRESMYALVNAHRTDLDVDVVVTCGGRNVMAQLWRLGELNAFPIKAKFGTTAQPTANGYYPLWLEPVADF